MNNALAEQCLSFWGRVLNRWPLAISAVLVLLLSGCAASPHYDTYTRFTPPSGPDAQTCLADCDAQLVECQRDCAEQRLQCVADLEPEVQQAFRQALDRYEIERQYYERQRADYEQDLRFNWGYGRGYYGRPGFFYPGWTGSGFWLTDQMPVRPPSPPKAPHESAIRERLIEQQCQRNCDCQGGYEQCFIGCGGQIERFTVCIAHCGPNDPRPPDNDFRPGLNLPTHSQPKGL